MVALKKAKASDNLIKAMMERDTRHGSRGNLSANPCSGSPGRGTTGTGSAAGCDSARKEERLLRIHR